MQTLIFTSDNKKALAAIKDFAKELDVEVTEKNTEETDEFYYWKGVKVRKAKGELDIKKMSGSIPNINMDPETFRKELWTRKKAQS
jgi:hypothetical protein